MEKNDHSKTSDFQPSDEEEGERQEEESGLKDNQKVIVGGMITEKILNIQGKNQVMAFLTLEDLVGTVEVMVFPCDYEKWQS